MLHFNIKIHKYLKYVSLGDFKHSKGIFGVDLSYFNPYVAKLEPIVE